MSKTDAIRQKATDLGKAMFLRGRGEGKALHAAQLEILDEFTIHPPATKEEATAFLRLQIKRSRVNLVNAKERGDNRAIAHLERKLAVYEYLARVIAEQQKANQPNEATKECPNCRVHSVDIFGHCHCCGKNW